MLSLSYENKNFFDDAWAAVQRREHFEILVKGFRAWLIKKAKPISSLLIENPQQPIRENRLAILRLLLSWGLATPYFWAIYIAAIGHGMQARWEEDGDTVRLVLVASGEGT